MTLNDEWLNFLQGGELASAQSLPTEFAEVHKSELHISTKTILITLSTSFDLVNIFWNMHVLDYHLPKEGVIKKQAKITTNSPEETREVEKKCREESERGIYITETIVENTKDKNVRKLNIGLCKKDVMAFNKKNYVAKGAFSNAFVFTLRIHNSDVYQEVHIKMFQNGKIEIPGMKCLDLVKKAVRLLLTLIHSNEVVVPSQMMPVLINSNFNCGFEVNRDILYDILQKKYRITAYYDQCSYPGIQCKYYFYGNCNGLSMEGLLPGQRHPSHPSTKAAVSTANIFEMSFFIFRTGNVLIVGRCNEDVLQTIFEYISEILVNEREKCAISVSTGIKEKRQKKIGHITINK
jgi:TATA-box binding protein (TBP) (component of TFIID and TFIIIB)